MTTRLKFRELGFVAGVCACCFADTTLRLTESRPAPTLRERFDRHVVPHIQRTATCSVCSSIYPVRATDVTPDAATKRVPRSNGPRRSTDPYTLSTGRDWRDTSLPV